MTYYYAIVDVNYIVTDVVEEVEPVDETGWIEIDSYNQDLVGLWYNVNNGTFSNEGNKYLIQLKNVDGAGCGLDADKLDGLEASAFALADHTHADSGTVGEHDHDDEYAPINHTHTEYAPVNHEHDGYADADHTHTGFAPVNHSHSEYAGVNHDHDDDYAPINHNHDSAYAGIGHDHDDDYAPLSHTHTGFASASHNHDSAYAAKSHTHDYAASSHNHDSDYLKLSGGTIDGHVNVTGSYKMDDYAIITNGNNDSIIFGSANKPTVINGLSTADLIMYGAGCWIPTIKPRGGNGTQNIGTPSYRFQYAYFQNTPNVSSDERLKQDIESVKDTDMLDFIEKLDVVNYAFKDEPDKERIGLIAQAVEKAGGEKFVDIDEEGMYGLRTADLVYPLISTCQYLIKKVRELESKLNE